MQLSGSRANMDPSRVLNGLAVRYFGTAEFYLAIFKVFLMMGLICYTFVTMVGGNPEHWAYGFTYWNNPVCQSQYFPFRLVLMRCRFRVASSNTLFLGIQVVFLGFYPV